MHEPNIHDELDRSICLAVKRSLGRFSQSHERDLGGIILPFLVGTGRVRNIDGEKMEVVGDAPFIKFNVDKSCIHVISNIKLDSNNNLSGQVTLKDNTFTVITADARQQSIMRHLLKIKKFPLEAADDLITLTSQAGHLISMDDSMLKALKGAPIVQGRGRILIRIKTNRMDAAHRVHYEMTASAIPCEDEGYRFVPGSGPSCFLMNKSGVVSLVKRNLTMEQQNYSSFEKATSGLNGWSLTEDTPERLLTLLEFVHNNPNDFVLEWPEGEEIKFRGAVSKESWHLFIQTNTLHEWFSIEGNLTVGNTHFSPQQVLNAAVNSGDSRYIKIGESEYIRMTDALRKQIRALSAISQNTGKGITIPKFFVGQLADIINHDEAGICADKEFKDLLQRVENSYSLSPQVPSSLNGVLRDYQNAGFQWMSRLSSWGAGACLADDMGLGKTIQTIAFILSKANEGPSLVISPTTVVANWKNELRRFAPSLKPIVLNTEHDREQAITDCGPNDVVLASYGILSTCSKELTGRQWNVICLDEAHQIKNRMTKVSQSAMNLTGKNRIILTGTPVQNNVSELWNLMQFINPGLFGKFDEFMNKFSVILSKDDDKKQEKEEALLQLKSMTQPFILRRTKDEVIRDIPTKTEVDYIVELTEREMKTYEETRSKMEEFYNTVSSKERMKFFFGDLGKLRRMACSMAMDNAAWPEEASKIRELRYLLKGIAVGDNRIVLFSQYTDFLSYVRRLLTSMGLSYLYMDGSTPMSQRDSIISDFQNEKCPIFVCSLKAGGIGINLTAANYVILLDPWWNPAIEQQAMDRTYRIGQLRDVTVIRLISYHTIEEKVTKLQEEKRTMSDDLLSGTNATASLSYEDIKELISSF